MKKVIDALLVFALGSLWILNFSSGIIGGIWLLLNGGWPLVILGLVYGFLMPYVYALASIPTFLLIPLFTKSVEKGNRFFSSILGFLLSAYNNFLLAWWVVSIFSVFMLEPNFSPIARWLWSYSVIMSAIGYMAHKEGPEAGEGTTMGILFTQLSILILTLSLLFLGNLDMGFILLWLALMLFSIMSVGIGVAMIPKKTSIKTENEATKGDSDLMVERALNILEDYDRASISLLQQKLGISYEQSFNVIEELERIGAIGPGPDRKVLFHETGFDPLLKDIINVCKDYKEVSRSFIQRTLQVDYKRASSIFYQLKQIGVISNELSKDTKFGKVVVGVVDSKEVKRINNEAEEARAKQ